MINQETARAMYHDRRKTAIEYLQHYFRLLAEQSGVQWDGDNDAELEKLVDMLTETSYFAVLYWSERAKKRAESGES